MKSKYLLVIIALALAIGAVGFVSNSVARQERLGLALKWSGLELPTISELNVKPIGSIYSREFLVSFRVERSELEHWLAESEKVQQSAVELTEDGREKYVLEPEAGAKRAELIVDKTSGEVELYVFWS